MPTFSDILCCMYCSVRYTMYVVHNCNHLGSMNIHASSIRIDDTDSGYV